MASTVPGIGATVPPRLVHPMAVGAPVSPVPSVEEVHQRTCRQQQERQGAHHVGPVLAQQEEAGHREEAEEDPGQRGAPLRAGAGCVVWTEWMVDHDPPRRLCGLGPSDRREGAASLGQLLVWRLSAAPAGCAANCTPPRAAEGQAGCSTRGAAQGQALPFVRSNHVRTPPGMLGRVKCAGVAKDPAGRTTVADAPIAAVECSLPTGWLSSRAPAHTTRRSRRRSERT